MFKFKLQTTCRMEQWMRACTCAGYEYMKLMIAELQRQLNEIEQSKCKYIVNNIVRTILGRISFFVYLKVQLIVQLNQHLSHHHDDKTHGKTHLIDQLHHLQSMLPIEIQIRKVKESRFSSIHLLVYWN